MNKIRNETRFGASTVYFPKRNQCIMYRRYFQVTKLVSKHTQEKNAKSKIE